MASRQHKRQMRRVKKKLCNIRKHNMAKLAKHTIHVDMLAMINMMGRVALDADTPTTRG